MPALTWIRSYRREWLGADLVAGATVWAVLVPSALAYAVIVGVDPIVGLYTVPLAIVGYALLGGSRVLVVGPDAAISVLAASTVAAAGAPEDTLALTVALSFLVGGVYVVLAGLRMGWIADLVPDPVLRGFIQGLVWVTILDQLPNLLGLSLSDPPTDFWRRSVAIGLELADTHVETALLGVASLLGLFALTWAVPRLPGALVVLGASAIFVAMTDLGDAGVSLVGEPSGSLFGFGFPSGLDAGQVADMVPGAFAIVLLGFAESMGAAKSAAHNASERLDPDQELLALGASNIGSGIGGGYVVTGALSKTSVAVASGAHTQTANLFAAALGVLTVVVLRPMFSSLADAVLAAIVVFAMAGTTEIAYFAALWRLSRMEFSIALAAFLGVLTLGVLEGVVVGIVLALVLLVLHVGDPPMSILGRTPEGHWRGTDEDIRSAPVEQVLVCRIEAPLVFLNARRLAQRVRALMNDDTRAVVLDASMISGVDTTGLATFLDLGDELRDHGVEMYVAHPLVRTWARAEAQAKAEHRTTALVAGSVGEAIDDIDRRHSTPR